MSGWRAIVGELYAQGGGPLPSSKFDVLDSGRPSALGRAQELGLIRQAGREPKGKGTGMRVHLWVLTQKGRAYVEGRYALVPGARANGPARFVATWLAALPPRNAIRLAPDVVTWAYSRH